MNVANRVALREHEHVDAILEIAVMVGESFTAEATLVELQGVNHGAHRPVEHQDSALERGAKELGSASIRRGHQHSSSLDRRKSPAGTG
jgi:hypothetical protein